MKRRTLKKRRARRRRELMRDLKRLVGDASFAGFVAWAAGARIFAEPENAYTVSRAGQGGAP